MIIYKFMLRNLKNNNKINKYWKKVLQYAL